MERRPLITAHTGCMGTPDNTLLSAEAGLKHGADVIEDDILVTRDGVPVLSHDDRVRTPDGAEVFISQMNYDDLSGLDIEARRGEGTEAIRIVKLEALLPLILASGKTINLDLKSDESIEPVSVLVEKYELLGQAFLSGCEFERAMMAKRTDPRLRRMLNTDVRLFRTMDYTEAALMTCEQALEAECAGININYRLVKPELLELACERNLPILVWTVDDEAFMRRFIDMGVYSITTRSVDALHGLIRERMAGG